MVNRIRIIANPSSPDIPGAIVAQWVGVEMIAYPHSAATAGGRPDTVTDGWAVKYKDAILALSRDHPDAAVWWQKRTNRRIAPPFHFPSACCEVVDT
jgi:hypothetical protein